MLEVDIDDSGTVDFFEFLCVARLISQGKGTSGAFIVPKLGTKFLYFFIGSIILIYIHIFWFFRGSSSFQEEDFDSSAKTEYSVQSLCCAIKVQYIPFRDVSVETLHVVASYRGAQGNMGMFSLEIRTLEKVTSKAALRTLTSIQDGPEYEKAQIMRFQEK